MKNIEWLKEEARNIEHKIEDELYKDDTGFRMTVRLEGMIDVIQEIKDLINQLDKPEILSHKWIDDNSVYASSDGVTEEYVHVDDLQNLLVPKQEEVDRAYKDGYEKGKQHTFYKGYLEGLADKEKEPETVASVIADFFKSLERFKEVISMEVEELEE